MLSGCSQKMIMRCLALTATGIPGSCCVNGLRPKSLLGNVVRCCYHFLSEHNGNMAVCQRQLLRGYIGRPLGGLRQERHRQWDGAVSEQPHSGHYVQSECEIPAVMWHHTWLCGTHMTICLPAYDDVSAVITHHYQVQKRLTKYSWPIHHVTYCLATRSMKLSNMDVALGYSIKLIYIAEILAPNVFHNATCVMLTHYYINN